jgi:hypothetical protein
MTDQRVLAFAGGGVSTPANTKKVLDNWIGDDADITAFLVPAKITARTQKGLASVVAYLSEEWGADDGNEDPFDTHPTEDLGEVLIGTAMGNEAFPFLIVILGETEPDEATAKLIREAREKSIPVLDLAAGLDEYAGLDDEPEVPAAEPESEPERPRRRRRSTETPEDAKPAETASGPSKAKRTIGKPRIARDEDGEHKLVQDAVEDTPPFDGPYKDEKKAASTLLDAVQGELVPASNEDFRSVLIVALEGALAALRGELAPPDEESFAFIRGTDGSLRKRGRGRPGRGEVVWLSMTQAKALGYTEEES